MEKVMNMTSWMYQKWFTKLFIILFYSIIFLEISRWTMFHTQVDWFLTGFEHRLLAQQHGKPYVNLIVSLKITFFFFLFFF